MKQGTVAFAQQQKNLDSDRKGRKEGRKRRRGGESLAHAYYHIRNPRPHPR